MPFRYEFKRNNHVLCEPLADHKIRKTSKRIVHGHIGDSLAINLIDRVRRNGADQITWLLHENTEPTSTKGAEMLFESRF